MLEEVQRAVDAGVISIMLFGIPAKKDECGSEAYNDDGIIQQAIRLVREHYPDLVISTDVCMCEYTSHGHCGLIKGDTVDNDSTL
ncbi:porphobilinogen synthase, partial [Acinetobacter sp. 163]|nr:porphobilinogen synthase [Acinetobacter sp. 163]